MGNDFWYMMGAHVIVFLVFRWKLNLKKKQLQREKAQLTIDKTYLEGQLEYYKGLADDQDLVD